jgi:hypothetical protein
MNRPRKHWLRLRRKERPQDIAGEYIFTHRGKEYRLAGQWKNDPHSPDGTRWIAASRSKTILTQIVAELADLRCEVKVSKQCWGWTPRAAGHRHHEVHKKMGGGFTDDRIWINDLRVAFWTCWSCHRDERNPLHWSKRGAA